MPRTRKHRRPPWAQQIQDLRRALDESTAVFGARFLVGGRTVEDWEQGRRQPRPPILRAMERLDQPQPRVSPQKRKQSHIR